MIKYYITTIIALISASTIIHAQSTQTVKTYYDPYTQVHLKEVYEINSATTANNGYYKQFDEKGIIYQEGYYKNGLKNGTFKYYQCAPGVISRIINYKNDVKDGVDEDYFCITDENGKQISKKRLTVTYSNGKWIKETLYYKNGNIEHLLQMNGISNIYYENGQKKEEFTSINDVYNGLYTTWYENGKIKITGNYSNGNGKYSSGKKIGKWLEYYENGNLKSEKILGYNNDIENSDLSFGKYYSENGKLIYEKDSLGGNRYIVITYDTAISKIISEINYLFVKKTTGTYDYNYYKNGKETEYYLNGNKKSETNYLEGYKIGDYREWYESANIKCEGQYFNNYFGGKWIYYYANGNKEIEMMYSNGMKQGQQVNYYTNGNVKSEGNNIKDLKDSIWNYYKEDGTLDYMEEYKRGILKSKKTKAELDNEKAEKEFFDNSKIYNAKVQEVATAYEVSDNKAGKKKNLFNAFLILFQDRTAKIASSKDNFQKVELTNELIKILDRMIVLSNSDTKEIEKVIKKESDTEKIKTILGL